MKKMYISACLLGVLLLTNCHDDLDKLNPNQLTVDTYFKNVTELQEAVDSVYSAMRGTNLMSREWFFTHNMRSPDYTSGGPALEAPRGQILTGGTTPDNPVMTATFTGLYAMIHRANTVIANAPLASKTASDADKATIQSLVAEARYLRGWAYFELVNFWGEVPIYTAPVSAIDEFKPRSPVADVYAVVIEDLKAAQAGLPAKQTGDNRGRASGDAATAFLAKAYLQQLDYTNARTELLKLYGQYSLTPVYNYNFREENEFNSESIWEQVNVANASNGFNWNGDASGGLGQALGTVRSQEINPLSWRNMIPSDKLLNEYETPANTPGLDKVDPRMNYTVYFPDIAPTVTGIPITPDTYKDKTGADVPMTEAAQGNANKSNINGKQVKVSWEKYAAIYKANADPTFVVSGINLRVLRYAEVLLMLAETEANVGDLGKAVSYLNELRARPDVQMPPYPTAKYPVNSKEEVMRAVIHESAVERGGEEGRDFDTLRWIRAKYLPTTPSPFENYTFNEATHMYLPMPQNEVSRNPDL